VVFSHGVALFHPLLFKFLGFQMSNHFNFSLFLRSKYYSLLHNIVLVHPIKDDYFKKFPFINRPRNTLVLHSCLPLSQLRSLSQSPPMSPQYVDRYRYVVPFGIRSTTGSTVGSRCGDRRYTRDLQIFVLSPGLVPNESRDTFHRAQDSTVVSIHLYVSRYSHTLVVYLTADFILDENKQLWLISIPAIRDT